ncbi:MAG: PepSY-like domain-containing protein [Acidobacteriota bacterium]|nr:PepSY-like domain-containing protein [Acidobacteriota bacterium]
MKLISICILGCGFGLAAIAAETKMKVDDLPAAVQSAMKTQTKGATILGASKERENGRMTYEVETKQDGKGRDLTFAEDGSLLEIEQEVDLESIPAAARQAIEGKAAGGTIKKVESVTQGSKTSYEADVRTSGGKTHEVAVNADGSPHKED